MKKSTNLLILIFIAMMVSCGNKKTYTGKTISDVRVETDTTIYARLDAVFGDTSIAVSNIKDNRRDTFDIRDAKFSKKIFGNINLGDTLAIMPLYKNNSIKSAYNLNEMTGLWLMKDGNGINLTIDGMAVNVGVFDDEISLRHWMIHNGMLFITYVLMDGSDYTERIDTSDITNLTYESLRLNINGKVYDCKHEKILLKAEGQKH